MPELTLHLEASPTEQQIAYLAEILNSHNEKHNLVWDPQALAIFVRDADGTILGGITGSTNWGWLHVNLLAVHSSLRNQGLGRTLMEMAETEAIKRGCKAAFLDTFSFQALGFYKKLGYELFGTLDDFPPGHKRYFLRKSLQPI
ncbi:MAG TPA: GNAT family N-acetyltransferase [Candidatus Obscuribacterales bacterium]